jgi:transcriptional regulator with XRE-family HTH domain
MVPLEWVAMLVWNEQCGENLKIARGKVSRRELAEILSSHGVECSASYIKKLEVGEAASVSTEIIVAIAKVLDVELLQIVTCLRAEKSIAA